MKQIVVLFLRRRDFTHYLIRDAKDILSSAFTAGDLDPETQIIRIEIFNNKI
jgi:hypothetical protein